MTTTAKPAVSQPAEDVLAAHIRTMHAGFAALAGDLGRSSPFGTWQALLQAGASREDIELVHAWLREHPAPATAT